MGLAVRHDALDQNPVRDVAKIRKRRDKPRAANLETLNALRAQLETWLSGKAIDGTPAYTSGPRRSRAILDIADVALATGARPGEVLAIRWRDINLAATVPELTISGTIVRNSAKGLHRQEWTKTDAGYRTVRLPRFVVDTLLRLQVDATANELDLVFPDRKGGVRDPHNFRRTWRQARGTEFTWITGKTFRKTVATLLSDEYGDQQAARQLGHSDGGEIVRKHYADKPTEVADFTRALDRFAS
nr:tyrosine-type recombinase/integrase [Nocardia bovistercoris]